MTPCPTDDTLGALVQRALDAVETSRVTSHLDECVACRQLVSEAVRAHAAGTPMPLGDVTPTLDLGPNRPVSGYIGRRLGRYQVRRLLGAGGMGQVYEAYDAELDRAIALKLIRPELAGAGGTITERLVRESRMMAKLVHPAVITVFDVGRVDDVVFIAMELISGETLGAHLARKKPAWRDILDLFVRAGRGLAAAHARGIVHRDFKPENVLVEIARDRVERVVVTDFGIARAIVEADDPDGTRRRSGPIELTATGAMIGTPAYMPPEQLAGEPVDQRADVFAFAVSVWEALFGQRPFPGRTIDELSAAMLAAPRRPSRTQVPARVIRALERALAPTPAARTPDLSMLLGALAPARSPARWIAPILVAAITGGAVVAGVRLVATDAPSAPCAAALAGLDAAYAPSHRWALAATLGVTPALLDKVQQKLDRVTAEWRTTHLASCRATEVPVQAANVAACLEARRLEIAGVVDDVITDGASGATYAHSLLDLIGEPRRCAAPASGLLASRVPADRALRRKVTALRYQLYAAEIASDRSDYGAALAGAAKVVRTSEAVWPPVHAEALFLLGTTQSIGGDNKSAVTTLSEAAAAAERTHSDHVAALAWIQLAMSMKSDEVDPARALEYTTYASAAVDRIGRPPDVTTLLQLIRGSTLIQVDRVADGEVALREALKLAESTAPEYLSLVVGGLADLYENQGRYAEAAAAYRRALEKLVADVGGESTTEIAFRMRLSVNLAALGETRDALAEAKHAVELSDRLYGQDTLDPWIAHANLAERLVDAGELEAGLAEILRAKPAFAKLSGERSERYGEVLSIEGAILVELARYRDAADRYARACDIIAFETGDDSSSTAWCWLDESHALAGLGTHGAALAVVERALEILRDAYPDDHPQLAEVYAVRGRLHAALAHVADATADLERAIAVFARTPMDPGQRADAEWELGKLLWPREPARARPLIEGATRTFSAGGPRWERSRRAASAWLAQHPAR
ncbi:MAG: serine/threonine kinase family protein [Myxococcales bacterium]|nr:serine/threonine kinase family protein [Myxococcales bacterium]